MTHQANPKHLPPPKSAAEYERELADLRKKLQAYCPHAVHHQESNGYEYRMVCPDCGLASDWQYRDSLNSRQLLQNLWSKAVDEARNI